jgi:hypothetical protein
VDENQFIGIGIFRNSLLMIFFGASQQIFFINKHAAFRKSSDGFNSKPLSNNDFMFLPMAILGSTE